MRITMGCRRALGATTYGHRLKFVGIASPGDVTSFEEGLEYYLRLFYSPDNLAALDDDDELKSLSDVNID